MKNKIKFLALFLTTSLTIISCSKDDDEISDGFTENINESYFSNFEIGNKDLIVSQSNVDIHIDFDYVGKSKASKIFIDIISKDIKPIKNNEIDYKLTNYLIPVERYQGQLNVNVHYHLYYNEEDKRNPINIPAEGTYLFKITVEHEDNTKSVITKEFQVLNKFRNLELGNDGVVTYGETELHTKFDYDAGGKTVSNIKYTFWFKEWKEGQNVAVGEWNQKVIELPKELYEGIINPKINYVMELPEELPVEMYGLKIEVTETGNPESISTLLPFFIK